MDQVVHRILWFERFALDLTRGYLRTGDQDIELRPKTFEVLRYLAENAGRLVSKRELNEAVWPNVAVTDDSLVQCIRELREKLGDDAHQLIKTMPRRGYLLDAKATSIPLSSVSDGLQVTPREAPQSAAEGHGAASSIRDAVSTQRRRVWIAAVVTLACVSLAALYTAVQMPSVQAMVRQAKLTGGAAFPQNRPTFKDCDVCPEMIVLPTGTFMMGSPPNEVGHRDVEGKPRRVTIGKRIAIGKFEVTVAQYAAFLTETGTSVGNSCRVHTSFDRDPPPYAISAEATFRHPGFAVTDSHPAACMSWFDAQSYVAWLKRRTGRPYRVPTEAEWEYAARAGANTRFTFGDDESQLCAYAKFADLATPYPWRGGCRSERFAFGSAQVGTFKANPWGIFDMHGNVWEWVEDCWTRNASDIPTDGSAFIRSGVCETGVVRGGSWLSGVSRLRAAFRFPANTAEPFLNRGFRVALSLDD